MKFKENHFIEILFLLFFIFNLFQWIFEIEFQLHFQVRFTKEKEKNQWNFQNSKIFSKKLKKWKETPSQN